MGNSAAHRGRVQAQGDDMSPEQSESWGQRHPPTKSDGVSFLAALKEKCEKLQAKLRVESFKKAERFVWRAPAQGVEAPVSKCFRVLPPNAGAKGARVDIEVNKGRAFTGTADR